MSATKLCLLGGIFLGNFSTLSIAYSGLNAASTGLYVTGHNISNVSTEGYSRQRALQNDAMYLTVGTNGWGNLKTGLGTDVASINHIRNKFLDSAYRMENSRYGFYESKYEVGMQIDNIFGELQSDYRTQTVIQDLWSSLQEIDKNPEAIETRGEFIETSVVFLDKMQNVYERLYKQQLNLNEQVIQTVNKVNNLVEEVGKLNNLIFKNEVANDNANDYRDQRNLALDELSRLVSIETKENPNGIVDVYVEGNEILVGGNAKKLGLRYTSKECSFVEPCFTDKVSVLEYDPANKKSLPLYNFTTPVNNYSKNDNGSLKSMLVTRGSEPVNYATKPVPPVSSDPDYQAKFLIYQKEKFNVEHSLIPKVMKNLDVMFNKIVTIINDNVAPATDIHAPGNYPKGLDGSSNTEVFSRATVDRYDAAGKLIAENPTKFSTLYSISNVVINKDLLESKGYNKLAFSKTGDVGNGEVAKDILDIWKSNSTMDYGGKKMNITDYYTTLITDIGLDINTAKQFYQEQEVLVVQIDNKRLQISGVSLDEEMKNMMVYQHAYNASARIVNVIDSMIDKIINGTGRVGI